LPLRTSEVEAAGAYARDRVIGVEAIPAPADEIRGRLIF
jgi:hypothetical protein